MNKYAWIILRSLSWVRPEEDELEVGIPPKAKENTASGPTNVVQLGHCKAIMQDLELAARGDLMW
jgi:hypothetical protein